MNFTPLNRALSAAILCVVGLASPVQTAQSQSIGVNFGADTPSATLLTTDQPGVVAGANWNNVSGASGTNIVLQDNNAAGTTALLTFNAASSFVSGGVTNTSNTGTNSLYNGTLIGDNTVREISIAVTNIPYATYDLYVYATTGPGGPQNTLSITNGTTTFYYNAGPAGPLPTALLQTTSTDPNNPTPGGGQYQLFSGLTGSSFSLLTGGSLNNVLSNNVFGLQIVATQAVPEPGSIALLTGVLSIGGLALRRRKK